MRRKIIAGNWKMHKTVSEAKELAKALKVRLVNEVKRVDVVVIPPFTDLLAVAEILRECGIEWGAQHMHWERTGALTGEVSGEMIKSTGARYVIIGHSERRQFFGETDETVNRRLNAALQAGLTPIVCIGETLEQRNAGETLRVLERQLRTGLHGLRPEELRNVVIAYEPVWAIGTGVNATPEQAQEAHSFIRKLIAEMAGDGCAEAIRIQYGGSVKPDNARSLLTLPDVDGALVGGASLDADSFAAIVKAAL
ncbi:MAG: triose-phosphate isomerase [candidate division KSB1 bacterium]|nr:triose-phosphate isomerase [candidate division KSB1 bacterium]MDZ7294973.1 triose-phosphate isomerase [candidate division KSB1 bacterium]MDZ7379043.1 triose-phosphate isomerase [candidate division KSB1 bacterium]MDZ7392401.1 triose-phosphate isomerase [candidate division KSB1 bacterium]MDZ7413510.1 triose-phosphate isomerase [candidate division KSB1 bacterium]